MGRILVATDGSESGTRALEAAARLARHLSAELLIATVGSGALTTTDLERARTHGMTESEMLKLFTANVLQDARRAVQDAGVPQIRMLDAAGDPAERLLDIAREEAVDWIVVGRRGRGRLAGLVLGSVSQKLASLAPCAVVVVP